MRMSEHHGGATVGKQHHRDSLEQKHRRCLNAEQIAGINISQLTIQAEQFQQSCQQLQRQGLVATELILQHLRNRIAPEWHLLLQRCHLTHGQRFLQLALAPHKREAFIQRQMISFQNSQLFE